ncbi:hypothetical protein R1T16_12480 [Flavobacterium sp. DG1-102-2]|uniref:hypothetical protein n=1 Tax=Flavobacterium sp. DG1-102-2 TaxID=3081663 RepID=UPI00294A0375|nr:hypothetical protein [Flavobacterium sp. DG1-102-2]MDV6169243.1 hypothetical protein [Flavobacterium sp. DG1-102-2]
MEVYFVVLQLPGSCGLKFIDGNSPGNFWKTVSEAINNKEAHIVSIRQDTGVSEELRSHVCGKCFASYFIFYLMLEKHEINNEELILQKARDLLEVGNSEALIDADDNFQLVTLDYIDLGNIPPNFGSGSPLLSA